MFLKALVVLAFASWQATCIDPPLMAESFQIAFDETFINNGTKYRVNGQMYYDAKNNRERVDRVNGRYDLFCASVMPNVTTSCTQTTVNGKRYMIYPQKKQCCFCCDSEHGCGPLKRDWLKGAQYLGTERLIDTDYDKWNQKGMFGYNYWYVTTDDNHIPRRLDEAGTHITDFLPHTFINKTFDDSYFSLPSYCTTSCPMSTICGKFRETNLITEEE